MSENELQFKFASMIPGLIYEAIRLGFRVTIGDAFRDPRAFGPLGISGPYGSPNSRHKRRLAIDLNLFKDGEYLYKSEDYRPLGEYWESMGGTWGGDTDGNHFELNERE